MKISDLPVERQAHLKEMRAVGQDDEGKEVLVGLTTQETSFYLNYTEQHLAGTANRDDAAKYLRLHDKHERARFAVLGAEHVLRTEEPSRH